jgi:hypothetical protein
MKKYSLTFCLSSLWLLLASSAPAASFFSFGATNWTYFVGTQEASTPQAAWRSNFFNDATWTIGKTPIGYGETDIAPPAVPTGTLTVYQRKTFVVSDPTQITRLDLSIRIDDGFVAWINGFHVGRTNVPNGELAFNAAAPTAVEPTTHILQIPFPTNFMVIGTNVVAIHSINQSSGSTDIYMDAALSGVDLDLVPPTVAGKFPVPGNLTSLNQVTVTFSEAVNGVQAADLLINGQPAASVTGSNTTYTFSFVQPAYGTVQISWAGAHGIEDFAFPPNPFDAMGVGATWQYNLIDAIAPTVVSRVPTAGFTIRSLTDIQIQFSEPVTGVNAGDLLITGNAATNVVFSPPATYTFQFPQPPTGAVFVAWNSGHGIKDLAASPNNFIGTAWGYTLNPNAPEPDVVITEFMAANSSTLPDEDGDYPDWIEIYNTGDIAVNLDGWHLTDNPGNLTKWTFPATNIGGQSFMIIFASGKDRKVPGRPLHTDFELLKAGEYLALVKADDVTIASSFNATPQADNVSYGLPTLSAPTMVLGLTNAASVYIPSNNTLGLDWTTPAFDDSSWLHGTNGVGFETNPAPPSLSGAFSTDIDALMRTRSPSAFIRIPFVMPDPSTIDVLTLRMKYNDAFAAYVNGTEVARRNLPKTLANSVSDFSDTQGSNNWYYGHYNKTADGNGTYEVFDFAAFPRDAGPFSATSYWTGTMWDWFAGNPPWTEISATGGHPNGSNNAAEHWAIRRWVSEVTGNIIVHFRLAKSNIGGGNGVTGRIFHNGNQIFSRTIAFNDNGTLTNDVSVLNVTVGDYIDIALDSTGTDGLATDGSDSSIFTAVIDQDPGFPLLWDSVAASARTDTQSTTFEDIDITGALVGMQAGTNWLAIHGVNAATADGDFLIAAQVETQIRALQFNQTRYFTVPTPGSDNGFGVPNLGPIISEVQHSPNVPTTNENILVTARVSPTFASVGAVTLIYRIMFMQTNALPMLDDGLHGDGVAGDGVYGAFIPSALSTNGQMRRWYITAIDNAARTTRFPTFQTTNNTPEYLGTIVYLEQTNNLPILHMFIVNPLQANNATGTKCSLFFNGEFYDNLGINLHGQSSSGFAVDKKSYDIDFHPEHNFRWKEGQPRVDDINLVTTYADKAKMRNVLPHETYRDAGGAHHFVQPVRVQQNGTFFAIYDMLENGDNNYLIRLGKDPNGALYKMYNTFTDNVTTPDYVISSGEAEKKTRRTEGNADLIALFNGLANTATPLQTKTNYLWDNINIPATINFLAARALTGDIDCCHKNYYFYRDSDGTGEWEGMPWDVDLSFGRNWNGPEAYFDNAMYPNNGLGVGGNNGVFGFLINTYAPAREMYLRRIRTIMDTLLQPTNTPLAERRYEKRVDELFNAINLDNDLDLAKWGTWRDVSNGVAGVSNDGTRDGVPTFNTNHVDWETLSESVGRLKQYLIDRRISMFARAPGEVPNAQPTNAMIIFGTVEFNPSSGVQAQEYIQLRNTNNYAVDMSGWKMSGAIDHTFRGGLVVPAGGSLYLSPDVKAFRGRAASPRGNEGRFVQGNYKGQLSARGESLTLADNGGRIVSTNAYIGAPSLPQQYLRITEIMYHPPAAPTGSPYGTEEFEYLELKNVGPSVMNLTGVHFTNGIEFTFTSANVTNLAAGATIVLARNPSAFASRYPGVVNVTGPFLGTLDNNGENLRLDDAVGEKILDFAYDNKWYPMTDGPGLSLVIVNENAPWFTWGDKVSWRPSSEYTGNPGGAAGAALTFDTILVNEVLSHTDLPERDAIELYNPTTNDVDVGNWLISDDFITPKKFRIPAPLIIPAGGYHVFTEADFNPGGATSFSFSSDGDEAFIFSGDSSGNPNGYYHGFSFDGAQNGVAFGRYVNSMTNEHFVAQRVTNTFLLANARPRVGPIIVSEIMYHPQDILSGTNILDDSSNEFVELQNITTNAVHLYDPAFPTNRWKLTDAINYVFSTNDVIPALGILVVVSFDPTTNLIAMANFQAKYGLTTNIPIVGPYSGKLDNSDDKVEIYRPDAPGGGGVPYILVERVHFLDVAPWDILADGLGASLQRLIVEEYGNEPTNWVAASPSPGVPRGAGAPPVFSRQPSNTTVFVAGSVGTSSTHLFGRTNFTALVDGPGVTYQWRFNGNLIPGATSGTLTLTNIQYSQAGVYSVLAFNSAGSVISSNAILTVTDPVHFTVSPTNQSVLPNTNVTLVAQAMGNTPVRYQWRFEGTNISNATNNFYSFTGANLFDHHGNWSVVIQDDISEAVSADAFIYVLVKPFVTSHIQPATVLQGGTAVFSLVATGAPTIWYRWLRGGTAVLTSSVPMLVLTNVQFTTVVRVALTNGAQLNASQIFSPSAGTVALTVLPDADGDGMWDVWETNYFGNTVGTNFALALPGGDADGDGMSNADEFRSGTNPTNALSVLKIVLTATNANVLQFVAETNLTYSVQSRTNISTATWTNLTNIGASPSVRTIQVNSATAPPADERYFRVITPRAP